MVYRVNLAEIIYIYNCHSKVRNQISCILTRIFSLVVKQYKAGFTAKLLEIGEGKISLETELEPYEIRVKVQYRVQSDR